MQIDNVLVKTVISDLGNGYRNSALLAAHFLGGVVVGFLAGGASEELSLKCTKERHTNFAYFMSFIAGTAASIYLAPHSRLVKFTPAAASYLSILSIAAVLGIAAKGMKSQQKPMERISPIKRNLPFLPFAFALAGGAGMVSGYFGYRSLIPFGAMGALIPYLMDS